jgi:cytochrome P450
VNGLAGLAGLGRFNRDRLAFLREAAERGDAAMVRLGPLRALLVHAPHLMQAVLVEQGDAFRKGPLVFKAFRFAAGDNLFTLEGPPHRRHRRLMAPALTPRHIGVYADTMVAYADRARHAWADGTTLDLAAMSTALTLSIAGETLFGADIFAETEELGAAFATITAHLHYLTSHIVAPPLSWPTPRNVRARRALRLLEGRIHEMIAARRAAQGYGDVTPDLLSLLVQARDEDGQPLTTQEITNEAMAVLGAGHETVAKALTWALYELARHPRARATVQVEIDSVLHGRRPRYDDLTRLPYTLQVIKETLRLYPPAYVTTRQTLRHVRINGYDLAKGSLVVLCIYTLHRRADVYARPDEFLPERFSPEIEHTLPRHTFLPFGTGAHVCIGNHFALMQLHLLLATLLQHHTFALAPGQTIVPVPAFVLEPSHAIDVVVSRR